MTKSVEELEQETSQLSTADKYRLARKLLSDADGDAESEIDDAWFEEIERRRREIEDGLVETRPASQVMADAYARLRSER